MPNCGTRAAETTQACALPPPPAGAIPHEGRGMAVPAHDGLVQPVDTLLCALGMLAGEGAAHQDALQGLGHVEPGPGERGVEREDAVLQEPAHQLIAAVSRQIVPDQEQA